VAGASAGAYLARGVVHNYLESIDGLLMTVPLIVAGDGERHVPAHQTLVADPVLAAGSDPKEADGLIPFAVIQVER
jgi:alpha-beta hydrolase superfamily lysophospholipase